MERLIATNSVALADADTEPATGTPQYATSGNPATNTPATVLPAYAWNMVQEELMAIVAAGGVTPARNTWNQVLTAMQNLFSGRGTVGSSRNLKASVTSSTSTTANFTADEIIVESALGGSQYQLANFNENLNIGTTGAGGMDTGLAPNPGFIAIYAIYNPTTNTQSILATNATSAAAPNVYNGAHMPSGYTASALISVWPTASGYLAAGMQVERAISFPQQTALYSSTSTSVTSLNISGIVPFNAKSCSGSLQATASTNSNFGLNVVSYPSSIGEQILQGQNYTSGQDIACNFSLDILTPQTIYYSASNTNGTPYYYIYISRYTI